MKRDMDLVRAILLSMEEHETQHIHSIAGYNTLQIDHHVWLMGQAGLLEVEDMESFDDPMPVATPITITWDGHDFINAVRDDTIWAKVKSMVLIPAAGVTFDVLLMWLKEEAKRRLGIS